MKQARSSEKVLQIKKANTRTDGDITLEHYRLDGLKMERKGKTGIKELENQSDSKIFK